MIRDLLKEKNMSIYRLSKESHVPYATVNDICNQKAQLEKCSAETVYRLASALNVSMEELLEPCLIKRSSFELFKSSICHRLKELGDIPFIIEVLEKGEIRSFYQRGWFPECLYLLAMLDYVSTENNVPLCTDYDDLRSAKLDTILYPSSVLAMETAGTIKSKTEVLLTAMPEFLKYNIVESEVRDIV